MATPPEAPLSIITDDDLMNGWSTPSPPAPPETEIKPEDLSVPAVSPPIHPPTTIAPLTPTVITRQDSLEISVPPTSSTFTIRNPPREVTLSNYSNTPQSFLTAILHNLECEAQKFEPLIPQNSHTPNTSTFTFTTPAPLLSSTNTENPHPNSPTPSINSLPFSHTNSTHSTTSNTIDLRDTLPSSSHQNDSLTNNNLFKSLSA